MSLFKKKDIPTSSEKHTGTDKCFGSTHIGGKSKEVLAQELFSLHNQSGAIMTPKERAEWRGHWNEARAEWRKRYGTEDFLTYWNKVFKK